MDKALTISLLLPTRNRTSGLRRMVESARKTADTEIEFCVHIDGEDEIPTAAVAKELRLRYVRGMRQYLTKEWNALAGMASGDILMMCSDDIEFRVPGWDTKVISAFEQFPDRIAFVHGDDGQWGSRLGTHGFLSRQWVDTVGYFLPPYFDVRQMDDWITEVADKIGRHVYIPEVLCKHMRSENQSHGLAPDDPAHEIEGRKKKDWDAWVETQGLLLEDVRKLRIAIEAAR